MWRIRDVYLGSRIQLFPIPDPNCLHPGSRILIKEFKYFNPKKGKKKWFLSSKKYDPCCSSRIRMLTFSHPGSRGLKDTQSRIPDPDPQYCFPVRFPGPTPSNGPCNGSCPPQNHYVPRHINNRYFNSYCCFWWISSTGNNSLGSRYYELLLLFCLHFLCSFLSEISGHYVHQSWITLRLKISTVT